MRLITCLSFAGIKNVKSDTVHMCINDCNNLIGRDRLTYEVILIKSLGSPADLNKLVPSVESAYVLFRPRFRPRVPRLFLGDTITRATARVTSGACTRSCNP